MKHLTNIWDLTLLGLIKQKQIPIIILFPNFQEVKSREAKDVPTVPAAHGVLSTQFVTAVPQKIMAAKLVVGQY